MRLLADENVPAGVIAGLRGAGHDVRSIAETARGMADVQVADLAQQEKRILITLDKDFSDLAHAGRLNQDLLVVLIRIDPPRSAVLLAGLEELLPQLVGDRAALWILSDTKSRRRPLSG